ncbi:MAG: AMP-binding protein [Ancrocorticia sp.]|uniref:AMP-binding protein n=1 Tax=Ancrocorticia sp. TaxID=2593684 RepID=UPI003F902C93
MSTTSFSRIIDQAHSHYEPGVPFEVPVPEGSIFELLEHSASAWPSAPAIDYFARQWTYRELLDESLKAAQVFAEAGIRKGDIISFAMPNCPQHLIAFYGAMRLGAIVAEINPLAPATQMKEQIERHGGRLCLAWEKAAGTLTKAGIAPGNIMTVDISRPLPKKMRMALRLPVAKARKTRKQMRGSTPRGTRSWDKAHATATAYKGPDASVTSTDTAVILHSSGTNGIPKSVPLTHGNIRVNVNQNLFWVYELDRASETFFSLLPYFHAFGMSFLLCCGVAIGACQIILPTFSPELALQAHLRRNVTFFLGVPPMFDRICKKAIEDDVDISTIKYAVSGGMSLAPGIAQAWEQRTGAYIIEGYGMSETSPTLAGSPLSAERRPGCLGLPFPNMDVRLADQEDLARDVLDGEPGELLVKGPQVFHGYLDAPEENEAAFYDGWFRTGDIVRNDDGFLYLVDRSKDLIITSGFNIFPSQVEGAIKRLTSAEDVVVVGTDNPETGEEVAAVIKAAWKNPDLKRLRATLEKELPHYALPRQLHMVDEVPHSLIGKPERKAVRETLVEAALAEKVTDSRAGKTGPFAKPERE